MLPTKFLVSWPFYSCEEVKNRFQDGRHLEFLIRRILAIFDLPVTPMLPTNWSFGSEEEAKNRFSRW